MKALIAKQLLCKDAPEEVRVESEEGVGEDAGGKRVFFRLDVLLNCCNEFDSINTNIHYLSPNFKQIRFMCENKGFVALALVKLCFFCMFVLIIGYTSARKQLK